MPAFSKKFAPPPERFGIGSMGMALFAHGCLIVALTWGINWHKQTEVVTVSAELWSEAPIEAAPPPVTPPPEPVTLTPEKPLAQPDIVTEKNKSKAKAEAIKRKEAEAEHQREFSRQDQINHMKGLAGATSTSSSIGSAKQSSAPSSSYAGKVKAKIRPNIVFQDVDSVQGNSAAEVDIRLAPDGTIIVPLRLSKSSGNKAWDNAVLRGIEKTEILPKDIDGRVPSSMTLVLRPKE